MKLLRNAVVLVLASICLPAHSAAIDIYGVIGGLNISSWAGDLTSSDVSSRSGVTVGGFACWKLSNAAEIVLEGLYSRKGTDLIFTIESAYESSPHTLVYRATVDYLEFPVLFESGLTICPGVRTLLMVGPVVSVEVGATYEYIPEEGTRFAGDLEGDLSGTSSPDFGGIIGGGVEISTWGHPVRLTGQYNYGVREVVGMWGGPRNRSLLVLGAIGF